MLNHTNTGWIYFTERTADGSQHETGISLDLNLAITVFDPFHKWNTIQISDVFTQLWPRPDTYA